MRDCVYPIGIIHSLFSELFEKHVQPSGLSACHVQEQDQINKKNTDNKNNNNSISNVIRIALMICGSSNWEFL